MTQAVDGTTPVLFKNWRPDPMKRFALLLGVAAMPLAQPARAANTPAKSDDPKKLHCAVETKNEIDIKKATADHMYADYKGNRYFFCCPGCPEAFKKEPAKYAKNDHIPTPK